jgi:HAD superfamily hydrolase (TIGR01456 family)
VLWLLGGMEVGVGRSLRSSYTPHPYTETYHTDLRRYGFRNVVTPGDIYASYPKIWPFASNFKSYYSSFARPLPKPIIPGNAQESLKIDAIFVFNDPRDWALDAHIILDVLLSSQGIIGTHSPQNNDHSLPNRGFLQDGQPPLYYSNPDLWWAAGWHHPRLGQGGFREALEGVWAAVTGGPREGVHLRKTVMGKPFRETYVFAERMLLKHRKRIYQGSKLELAPLKRVFMVGDNPESDIRGANTFQSPVGAEWSSILVRSGVYNGGESAWKPNVVVDDIWGAVQWALKQSKWEGILDR